MKIKINKKKACAAALGVSLLAAAIIPYTGKKKAEAFSSAYGVCIDNHNYSTSGSWSQNDHYTNKLLNMNEYTYGTPEYKNALATNVERLHQYIGSDEQIVKLFWSGIATWVTNSGDYGGKGLGEAQYWANYANQGYQDSVWHGYTDALTSYNFVQMTEAELGMVLHGNAGQAIIDRDPFLSMLANPDTLFSGTDWKQIR